MLIARNTSFKEESIHFEDFFTSEYLDKIYREHIIYSSATGIDLLTPYRFNDQAKDHIDICKRKISSGSYRFTKYKLKLISKGRGKNPREISIPTVRDRIVLKALNDFLNSFYREKINLNLPQRVVKTVSSEINLNTYDHCIKLDVSNFYPSILHENLIQVISDEIDNLMAIELIKSAITSPSIVKSKKDDKYSDIGVPQGLSISNILAEIYLLNVDSGIKNSGYDLKYHRYVDDVLIFCHQQESDNIIKHAISCFDDVGLKVYPPNEDNNKSSSKHISRPFSYLGYKFVKPNVTVKPESIERLKESIVAIFTSYKYSKKQDLGFLLWRLNLRITGCVFETQSKGWLFFFSEINDEQLLHRLDHFVRNICRRFGVDIVPKRFVRSFKELKHRKYETNYIPNFDEFNIDKKKNVLEKYFNITGLERSELGDEKINYLFHKKISKQVKDLLVDVQTFS